MDHSHLQGRFLLICLFIYSFTYVNCTQWFHCYISISVHNIFDYIHFLLPVFSLWNHFNRFHYSIFICSYKLFWSFLSLPSPSDLTLPWLITSLKLSWFYAHIIYVLIKSRFCTWQRTCNICLFESGLFFLAWCSPVVSIFLWMT
jgi:hypothetical protein